MYLKKIITFVFLATVFFNLTAITYETGSLRGFFYGEEENCEYDNWVSHITEGIARTNYNLYAPWEEQTEGFGAFHIPDEIELLQWSEVYTAFIMGEMETAETLIDSFLFPYEVVDFQDTDSGNNYKILREIVDYSFVDDNGTPEPEDDETGAFGWGWGMFLYNPAAAYPIIISAPHPNDDYITVPMAIECLEQWDAMFLFISGAGREVEWTEIGSYSNSKSISDPTRNSDHPLIISCRLATDMIRENWRREFSFQLHSYDWNRHANHANCQASVVHSNPNLPLRDLSELHLDMINQADMLMIPEGEYGDNSACYLNDYYAVNYNTYPFYYVTEDTTIVVNNRIDLPGVGGDFRVMAIEEWNPYDVYDPFFHLEMDELPNQYPQISSQLQEFYGYNSQTEEWDFAERFTRTIDWYHPWVDNLGAVLPATFELDDGLEPTAIDSIWFDEINDSSISVNWFPEPAYDFYTHRIFIDTLAIDPEMSPYYDRNDFAMLASPLHDNFTISGLELNHLYNVMIASVDYNDNIVFSENYTTYTAPAIVDNFAEFAGDGIVDLHWTAVMQSGNQGFNIYRRIGSGNYELIAEWEDFAELVSNNENEQEFLFSDDTVNNNNFYRYMISMTNLADTEYMFDDYELANPRAIFSLTFSDEFDNQDAIDFSWNYYATNSFDQYYDLPISSYQGEDIYTAICNPSWTEVWTERDIRGYFNPLSTWKSWDIKLRSQLNADDPVTLWLSDNYPANYHVYLLDNGSDIMYNLQNENISQILVNDIGAADLTLYAGDVTPDIDIINIPNVLLQSGDELVINYEAAFPQLIDYYSLTLVSTEDAIILLDSISTELPDELVWTVPDTLAIYGAKLRINYTSYTGENFVAVGNYTIGIISDEYEYDLAEGWHNFSSVWIDSTLAITDVFGDNAQLYTYADSSYVFADSIVFGTGYWLELSEGAQISAIGNYQLEQWQYLMTPGWNLLPNPFPCPISVEGLEFEFFSINHDFRGMVELGLLSYNVYAYRDSAYIPAEIINPGESFYIYNLQDEIVPTTAIFIPGNSGTPLPDINANFLLGLEVSQLGDNSKCIIGRANNSYDGFDEIYDFPALPPKPENHGCRIALTAPGEDFPEADFQTLFIGGFWEFPVKEQDFVIKAQPDNDLSLSFDEIEFPLDYFAEIMIGDVIYDLDLIDALELETDEIGEISGTAYIHYPRVWDYGNIDKNGGVGAFDAALVLQHSVGIDPTPMAPLPWLEWRMITADVDGNEEIESYDASLILQYSIDIITGFPVNLREEMIPPRGTIALHLAGKQLEIISLGNVYSLELSIPAKVVEFMTDQQDILWAGNQMQHYQLAIASANEITHNNVIGKMRFEEAISRLEYLIVLINGRETTVEIERGEIPQVTGLSPIYPNPFVYNRQRSANMRLNFALAETGKVNISIYNIRGQKVKELMHCIMETGSHEINWDLSGKNGRSVSSGIYFLKMSAPEYLERRKFIILK